MNDEDNNNKWKIMNGQDKNRQIESHKKLFQYCSRKYMKMKWFANKFIALDIWDSKQQAWNFS